jgi:Subtilase family
MINFKMLYALLVVFVFIGYANGELVRYKVDTLDVHGHGHLNEVRSHFKPLHILPNGEFISSVVSNRRDLGVKRVSAHERNFTYYNPSRRLIVHSISNLSTIRSVVGHKDIVIKERQFEEDNTYEKVYVLTFLDDQIINKTLLALKTTDNILWMDFIRPMHISNLEAIKTTMGQYVGHESGKNTIITVTDTGVDVSHCMFQDPINTVGYHTLRGHRIRPIIRRVGQYKHSRIKAYVSVEYDINGTDMFTDNTDEYGGHGTHVAGSAAGRGCGGIEDGAKLLVFDVFNASSKEEFLAIPDLITPMMHLSYIMGSRIFSNSWGSDDRLYTSYEYELDRFVLQHPDYVCVFAAGNEGDKKGTVGSPGSAKNCITVGASLNTYASFYRKGTWGGNISTLDINTLSLQYTNEENMAAFSSRGPTADGRIKPDIVVPGLFVLSAQAGSKDGFMFMQGTSMATPIVSRIVSMIIERLGSPSAPLVKSILVACSKHMHGGSQQAFLKENKLMFANLSSTPLGMNDYGHGRLHIDTFFNGLLDLEDNLYVNRTLTRSYYCLKSEEITIVMAYNDYPSIPGLKATLVNNIDMFIEHNARNTCVLYYPNGLTSRDMVNNVEKITLTVSKGDFVTIHILPGSIPANVALVMSSSLDRTGDVSCDSYIPQRRLVSQVIYTRLPKNMLTLTWICIFFISIMFDWFAYTYFLKRAF